MHFRKSLWLALLEAGYTVTALAPADGRESELTAAGICFVELPQLKRFDNYPLSDFHLYRQLVRIYRERQPAIILHFTIKPNIFGTLAASQVGIPSIATITGLGTTWLNGLLLRTITKMLYRYSLPLAKVVVGQNAHDLEALQKIGVAARQWQLIPGSGIDVTDFHPSKNVLPQGKKVFLFLGRMLKDKGLEELFTAWRQIHHLLPHAHLQLLGEFDPEHPRCIPQGVWEQGLNLPRIKYLGYQEEVCPHLAQSNIVILPSYREGIPRSLLEAMAMAKPVIATDVPGCRELAVPRKTGWRVPARSSAALAEAILEAYRCDEQELNQMGERGRQLVEEGYSSKIVAGQYLELIEKVRN